MSYVIAAIAITGQVVSTFATIESGKAAEEAAERKAEEERIAAQTEELKRREELNRVLASNILSQATSGIATEGTPASLALEQAKTIGESEGVLSLSQRLRERNLLMEGRTAKSMANLQAAGSLMKAAPGLKTDIEELTS
jgi:hypothetical protein|tara:strand:- start:49 stop:468 length:420 start_codon:yes stop_codon:yes gene_type:complete